LTSFHEHSPPSRTAALLEAITVGDVALVSDAGTPAVSDPGAVLVAAAAERGVSVVSVPGPSAVTAALAVSGFPADRFMFLGFLPRRQRERRALLQSVARQERAIVALEAPHRLRASLADVAATLGDRRLAVCRELTKVHEEVFHGTATEALVMEGAEPAPQDEEGDAAWAREELRRLRGLGGAARDVVSAVAGASGLPRRQVTGLWLELQSEEAAP
jgi:16S rRNA (cytidine1402-2'-O)-methyltransferase